MTTTTTPETPLTKIPKPFDDRGIGAMLEKILHGNREEGVAVLRDVYARGLEHAAAVCSYTRAGKMADAAALKAPDEKSRAKHVAAAIERTADACIRSATAIRAGVDVAGEIDELRRFVIDKGEPDPGSVLGWLRTYEKDLPPKEPPARLEAEPKATRATVTLVARAGAISLPLAALEVGTSVTVQASGFVRRFAEDRRPDGLHVALEVTEVAGEENGDGVVVLRHGGGCAPEAFAPIEPEEG